MTELDPNFAKEARSYAGAEVPLQINELFYSRTDQRGVIKAGNSVFQRVSGYEWEDLIGAPHKIVRHPDMPKGLFQLLWNTIKKGDPIAYYVKNRDKSGRYYWVLAVVRPCEGDFLSTRIKPAGSLMASVKPIYAELRRREEEEGLSPADSADELVRQIQELGYSTYLSFQSEALAQEVEARCRLNGRSLEQMQKRFKVMAKGIQDVQVETAEMTEAFKAIRTVPMNMRIIASRLENAGGPISAISVNYSQMLEEMSTWVKTFVDGEECVFARIRDAIFEGQFFAFVTAVESDMQERFSADSVPEKSGIDVASEMVILDQNRAKILNLTEDSLARVEAEAKRFGRSVLDMKRYVTGLSSTRMMCKIESASLSNTGTALAGIVDQLDACQNEIEQRLARIVELNAAIQSNTSMLRSLF